MILISNEIKFHAIIISCQSVKSGAFSKHLCAGNVAVQLDYFCAVWLLGDKTKPQ